MVINQRRRVAPSLAAEARSAEAASLFIYFSPRCTHLAMQIPPGHANSPWPRKFPLAMLIPPGHANYAQIIGQMGLQSCT